MLVDGRFDDTQDDVAASIRSIGAEGEPPVLDIDRAWVDAGVDAVANLYANTIHSSPEGQTRAAEIALDVVRLQVIDCQTLRGRLRVAVGR